MAHLLFYGTHGSDEPTRAVLPFHFARGALEAGHTAEVILVGDAATLMIDSLAKEVTGVAVPNAAAIIAELVAQGLPMTV